jgi:hypothetical protein
MLSSVLDAEGASEKRLTIVNQCANNAWAILTPGGDPNQPEAKANSGGWFRAYAVQERFIDVGAMGSIALGSKN